MPPERAICSGPATFSVSEAFIAKHRNDADPDVIQDYERESNKLGQAEN
jgi:hypothetical protein